MLIKSHRSFRFLFSSISYVVNEVKLNFLKLLPSLPTFLCSLLEGRSCFVHFQWGSIVWRPILSHPVGEWMSVNKTEKTYEVTFSLLVPVTQRVDSDTHWINLYPQVTQCLLVVLIQWTVIYLLASTAHLISHNPQNNSAGVCSTYPIDSDLSNEERYPMVH